MLTFSIGIGHVRGTGPRAGERLSYDEVQNLHRAIKLYSAALGGRVICATEGYGTDELGQAEACSIVVAEVPEDRAHNLRYHLGLLAPAFDQRCFGVVVGETEFIGPVVPPAVPA